MKKENKRKRMVAWQRMLLIFTLITAMFIGGCTTVETDSQGENGKESLITDDRGIDSENSNETQEPELNTEVPDLTIPAFSIADIPAYSGSPYVVVNDNNPYFSDDELTVTSFESYSELDYLGRCGVTYASIGTDIMPTEERGSIGQVKPTGWHTVKYDIVDGNYLYNRCHLIGYQLTGENANTKNLITGTRYMNVDGMLPFENMVADYVKETSNHVQYRVTPIFEENNMVASGVLMEAKSVEDNGEGICFNVYVYNVQPGITINYANGESRLTESDTNTDNSGSIKNDTGTSDNTSTNDGSSNNANTNTNNSASANNDSNNKTSNDNSASNTDSGSSSGGLVWKSATGKKYHSINDCGNMNPDKATQITKEEAEELGLEPCSKCY